MEVDEANPATWITPAEKSTSLLQVAGWLISFSLDANARRCRHVIAVRGHRC